MTATKSRRIIQTIGLMLSLLCVWLIARAIHPDALAVAVHHLRPLWLVPAALTLGAFLALNALRWRSLVWPAAHVPAPRLLRWQLIGYLGNTVFPFRAGEVARIILVSRNSVAEPAQVAASIVIEKICDGAALVGLLVVALLLVHAPAWVAWIARLGAVAFALGLIALLILATERCRTMLQRRTAWPRPVRRPVRWLTEALVMVPGPRALSGLLAQSLLLWAVDVLNTACVLQAMHTPVTLSGALLVTAGLNLAQIVPAGPAAIGTYEAVVIALLGTLGVASAPAQLAALGLRAVQYAPPATLGLFAAWLEGFSWSELRRTPFAAPGSDPATRAGPASIA